MNDVPIRRLTVSDFRRIKGMRVLPFDAPVVLIHGPNGTGKTSVLSALELALTGSVRSMERQSDKYFTHLPSRGQRYATVLADVADYLQAGPPGVPLTVDWSKVDGAPALDEAAAQFYAERCYLDQASLGRLLELYQARTGNEETALEKFINELLGLEKLDALRSGLSEANDLRLLKRLAAGLDEADRESKAVTAELKEQSEVLADARAELASARTATREAVKSLVRGTPDGMTDGDLLGFVRSLLNNGSARIDSASAAKLRQELIALGGRLEALTERPSTQRLEDARASRDAAAAARSTWEITDGATVLAWENAVRAADVGKANTESTGNPATVVAQALRFVEVSLKSASDLDSQIQSILGQLDAERQWLGELQGRLAAANEDSSALVEGLAALLTVIDDGDSVCPVCDREFTESREGHDLAVHVGRKLNELNAHSAELVELRTERDQVATRVARLEAEYVELEARVSPAAQQVELKRRRALLQELANQVPQIEAANSRGAELARRERYLQEEVEDLEAASSEAIYIGNELTRYARLLGVDLPSTLDHRGAWTKLLARADAEVSHHDRISDQYSKIATEAARLNAARDREASTVQRVADLVEGKKLWDDRLTEAKRRQGVAKEVREAATSARTAIVHRVFTESLNDVWKSMFTRLAPDEVFIPRFGIPTATKKTFDIRVETTHRDGQVAGPPQLMLSAGNLNTAALSLFLALHLAVAPIVPCLVFDDPVQAMDEVHVTQFAGLIRILAKQNGRQVVIAVHERELFEYLALELSPAYEGDELITIELGERSLDEDEGITRHRWAPDSAIAG